MFGIGAWAGRVFTSKDDTAGAPPVAVMSYHTWQAHFGLDPGVVGAAFTINQVPYTVIGMAPPGFFGDTLQQRSAGLLGSPIDRARGLGPFDQPVA
jgi:hypothetical protein